MDLLSYPVLELIVASLLSLAPAEGSARETADLTQARRLFDEGIARYDYEGAIEVFTLALGEVRGQGVDDFTVRGLLLFNIGRAHMRAHEIDKDVEHLRQAQAIFERFVEEAEAYPDEIDEADVNEARAQLDELERMLAAAERPDPEADPTPAQRDQPSADATKLRARGIGLTVAGAALLGGGVGMLVWGTGYGPAAEAKVAELDTLGLPADSPAYADADTFIAEERRKGAAWMAAGGVTAAIGVQQLVKAKKVTGERSLGASASFTRESVWFGVSGRF